MILRARWVIDRRLGLRAGARLDVGGAPGILDLGDSILMPGLVNAHAHLDYAAMRGGLSSRDGFTAWIRRMNRTKSVLTMEDYGRSIHQGLEESLGFGTTALANWICHPEAMEKLAPSPLRVWWFWEQIAWRSDADPRAAWRAWPRRVADGGEGWKAVLAPHAPYTCRPEIIQAAARWSAARSLPWSIHVAESREEEAMFRHGRGTLHKLMAGVGREMRDCGGGSPLASIWTALRHRGSRAILVHANTLDDHEMQQLGRLASHAAVAHCPRSSAYFGHPPLLLEELQRQGVTICLGTDSLASNRDLSMFREMACLRKLHPGLSPKGVLAMATIHGAKALGAAHAWPRWQDWIAIPSASRRSAGVWEEATSFKGRPRFVMADRRILTGK